MDAPYLEAKSGFRIPLAPWRGLFMLTMIPTVKAAPTSCGSLASGHALAGLSLAHGTCSPLTPERSMSLFGAASYDDDAAACFAVSAITDNSPSHITLPPFVSLPGTSAWTRPFDFFILFF